MAERKDRSEKHGVIFALWDGKNIQLEKRIKPGKFQGYTIIPGGGVETDETLEEALLREIREEYGTKVIDYINLGSFPSIEDNGFLNVRHLYLVTEWEGVLSNPENKNQHIECSIEEALLVCTHPLSQIFLRKVQQEVLSR